MNDDYSLIDWQICGPVRVITTVKELEELPVPAVLEDGFGDLLKKVRVSETAYGVPYGFVWEDHFTNSPETVALPVTVLWEPASQSPLSPTDAEVEAAAAVIWHETANDTEQLDYNAIAKKALTAARRVRA